MGAQVVKGHFRRRFIPLYTIFLTCVTDRSNSSASASNKMPSRSLRFRILRFLSAFLPMIHSSIRFSTCDLDNSSKFTFLSHLYLLTYINKVFVFDVIKFCQFGHSSAILLGYCRESISLFDHVILLGSLNQYLLAYSY